METPYPRCGCCKAVIEAEKPWCWDDDGRAFCSARCYQAYVENIIKYLEAAAAGRHYFEVREKEWVSRETLFDDYPIKQKEAADETHRR